MSNGASDRPAVVTDVMDEPVVDPTTPSPLVVHHRAERGRKLFWSIFTSLLIKPLAVITPLVTVRLFVPYLGTERYGLYESVAALTIWIGMSHFGLTMGLINKLTECSVTGDRETARRYVSSVTIAAIALAALGTFVLTALVPLIDWQVLFPANDPRAQAETPWAILFSAWITMLGLVIALPFTIYVAYQETYRANVWDGIGRVATLAACIAVVYTQWGVVGVVIASAGMPMLVRIPALISVFYFERPWLRPHWRYFDRTLLWSTMRHGLGLFFIQVSAAAIFQTDKLIISKFLGTEAVTSYAIIGRLFLMVYGLFVLVIGPLWPAFGDALRRGDVEWARKVVRRTCALGCGAVLACGIVMFFFGNRIVAAWTGGESVTAERSLVVALTCMFILWTWVGALSILLNAAGVVRAQIKFISAHAVLSLALAIWLVQVYGVVGVAWAIVISGLLTSAWGYPWMLRRHVWRRATPLEAPAVTPPSA